MINWREVWIAVLFAAITLFLAAHMAVAIIVGRL